MNKFFIAAMSVFLVSGSSSSVTELCEGIAPENNEWVGVERADGEVTEEIFNFVNERIHDMYAPVFEEQGYTFEVQSDWEDGTVNAYAQKQGSKAIIKMFGGLARKEIVTSLGFASVACHEVGHHLAGTPTYWSGMSVEGEADYFAMLKCLREFNLSLTAEESEFLNIPNVVVSDVVRESCATQFTTDEDVYNCEQGGMAGLSLAGLLAQLGNKDLPQIETPDEKVVSKTNQRHPAAQCRLDTYFQGTLCEVSYADELDMKDEYVGACSRANNFEEGNRPLCWYKPKSI